MVGSEIDNPELIKLAEEAGALVGDSVQDS